MGYGDEIMATGMAKGFRAAGKLAAFGDGERIVWTMHGHQIFANNPNVARPGQERDRSLRDQLVWIKHYPGHRLYGRMMRAGEYTFEPGFSATPGEIYFAPDELERASRLVPSDAVILEPHVKAASPNKVWSFDRMAVLSKRLVREGHRVVQFNYGRPILPGAATIKTVAVREALAGLAQARAYVGPEGMMHHAAAALGKPAVVIFGGYISPATTGYPTHVNLVGSDRFCGRIDPCQHCEEAMARISVDDVFGAVMRMLT